MDARTISAQSRPLRDFLDEAVCFPFDHSLLNLEIRAKYSSEDVKNRFGNILVIDINEVGR